MGEFMKRVYIVFWSGTGNTEKMAQLINQGVIENAGSAKLTNVSEASIEDIKDADVLALGSPSMGNETIEETEMEPFIDSIKKYVKDKQVALFGSYGWGDGEWMRSWEDVMSSYGANIIKNSLIVNGYPEGEEEVRCIEFGKSII